MLLLLLLLFLVLVLLVLVVLVVLVMLVIVLLNRQVLVDTALFGPATDALASTAISLAGSCVVTATAPTTPTDGGEAAVDGCTNRGPRW